MATKTASSPLENLDLSGEEVQRLTSAFQDPEFRRLFSEYAQELTNPENRRRYEAEVTALERERGVEVRFVHPEPGHVLRTSLDGTRRCFVNVCSNALVEQPSRRPGREGGVGSAPGTHWSLPYSLAPGRQYAGRRGTGYTVYDVVFHPDALALARRHQRFREMLDATALEAVEKQFHVQLDRRNARTLKMKYKGTPEAAVLRRPLPGGAPTQPEEEPAGPLPPFPYPYPAPPAAEPSAPPPPPEPAPPEAARRRRPAPTEPRCGVVQRHHVDLQDYRCARDSAPGPVPHELVVTIELPLLRSAEQAALEVTGKLLCLDSREPDYRLRLSLPYPVDDSRGKAQFNKARRQLVVTLPVAASAVRRDLPADPRGTDGGAACASARPGEAGPEESCAADPGRSSSPVGAADAEISSTPRSPEVAPASAAAGPEERDSGRYSVSPPGAGSSPGDGGGGSPPGASPDPDWESPLVGGGACGDHTAEAREEAEGPGGEPSDPAMGGPGSPSGTPRCPPVQCDQDEDCLTLLVRVPRIQPQSLRGELTPLHYKLCFSTPDSVYSFLLQFAPGNKLSPDEPAVSLSSDNAVIVLAKSPESRGYWREWYWGLNDASLEERLFVSEENVDEFLDEVLSSPSKQATSLTSPLIEVLHVTDEKIEIHAKLLECSNPDQFQEKERSLSEGGHLTEKDNLEHLTTDSDSSVALKELKIDTCDLVTGLEPGSLNDSQILLEKSKQPKANMEPEFTEEKSATYSNEEKDNLEVITKEKEFSGDQLSSLLSRTVVHKIPDVDSIKETNMQDGSVEIIKDHVTHCAFSFQNSLLYDLD
ncbi:protein kintoun [Dipodomys spectabilis]|uniref:protein kintoun n=1 Tax=Dipodomys spectabilis TaxID=105255 RepID=UPI001C544DE9|nr:protein kintoun [Dipodomys spectabilis]XP_042533785.1 protein kintoun [Dipodomys spectabilis]